MTTNIHRITIIAYPMNRTVLPPSFLPFFLFLVHHGSNGKYENEKIEPLARLKDTIQIIERER